MRLLPVLFPKFPVEFSSVKRFAQTESTKYIVLTRTFTFQINGMVIADMVAELSKALFWSERSRSVLSSQPMGSIVALVSNTSSYSQSQVGGMLAMSFMVRPLWATARVWELGCPTPPFGAREPPGG